jgi:hypothetical protein
MATIPPQLAQAIIDASIADTWELACLEWQPAGVQYEHDGTCICGHRPIYEQCFIVNSYNSNFLKVGNVCIKHFMDMPELHELHRKFKLLTVYENYNYKTPKALLQAPNIENVIGPVQLNFLLQIQDGRRLSAKQIAWRVNIHKQMIRAYRSGLFSLRNKNELP